MRYTDPTGHKIDIGTNEHGSLCNPFTTCNGNIGNKNVECNTIRSCDGITRNPNWALARNLTRGGDTCNSLSCGYSNTFRGDGPDSSTNSDASDTHVNGFPFGDILNYRSDHGLAQQADASVVSVNFVEGMGSWYAYGGLDIVWTSSGFAVFQVGGYDFIPETLPPVSHDNALTPQLGVAVTVGSITSVDLRNDPSTVGIQQAYKDVAKQEGFSVGPVTVNGSSSTDLSGNPNFQTTSNAVGINIGIPDIIAEYHMYTVDAVPLWPRR